MASTNTLEPGSKHCVSPHRWLLWFAFLAWCLIGANVRAQEAAISVAPSEPHLESCTEWGFRNSRLAITNNCKVPIAVMVLLLGTAEVLRGDANPGLPFFTGVGRDEASDGR